MVDIAESVREALISDAEVLTELQLAARAAIAEARGGLALLAEQAATDWDSALVDGERAVFVGCLDGAVVGYLEMALGPIAVVRQVYVHPEARELGLGDWLIEAALQRAASDESTALEGAALPGDRHTKNLYERAGIVARKIIVATVLADRQQ
jgi:GNAT superfamily N-acetyltransferase